MHQSVEGDVTTKASVHFNDIVLLRAKPLSDFAVCSGRSSPSSNAAISAFVLRSLKNSFFWAALVPHFYQRPRTLDVFLYRSLNRHIA
jgi:hypothetical protein